MRRFSFFLLLASASALLGSCGGGGGSPDMAQDTGGDMPGGPVCGDMVLTAGEACDTGVASGFGACPMGPSDCDDTNVCTVDAVSGSACQAMCTHAAATCADGDGCCPVGCNMSNDDDCGVCGDGTVDAGETCDGNCPTSCASDGNACTSDATTGSAGTCDVACPYAPITACANADGCCPNTCTNANDNDCAASYCTLIYAIAPSFQISGTTLGAGDTTQTLPEGNLVLRVEANGSSPMMGGAVELLNLWVDFQFVQMVSALGQMLTINSDVNGFSATCNGMVNPVPAGETMAPYTTPPAMCAYTDTTTTMATGTFTGTQITWGACSMPTNYGTGNYTPTNSLGATGAGCLEAWRSVGIVNCAGGGGLVTCNAGGLTVGQNLSDTTSTLLLQTINFTNGVQNLSMGQVEIPNDRNGRTRLQFTGTRRAGVAGGTCN